VEQLSFDSFLKTVVRSGLFTPEQMQVLSDSAPSDAVADAKNLASYLVKSGKLSRFQAAKLLEGVTLGLVLGPFHVLAPIGKGGMGQVYLGRDNRNGSLVAIKVLPPKRAKAQERLVARFRREMEISQRVVHPHLTRTIDVGIHLGINYIAMEYIPGKNLHKLIGEQGPLKVPRAARMFAEAALGLDYAHRQGLIHRDLKPSNVMVMPDDHVKVLDLGLALIQGESDAERTVVGGQGYVVGTLDFLAPEQAEDALKVDPRSDIYSLGCTMYFALTGSPPFSGGNALQKMLRHRCDPPKPVCAINPSVPATFAVLLTRMLAKKPEMRFQTAGELREALLPWIGDTPAPISTRKKTPVPPPAMAANGQNETMPPAAAAAKAAPPGPAPKGPAMPAATPTSSPAPAWAVAAKNPVAVPVSPAAAPVVPSSASTPRSVPAPVAATAGPGSGKVPVAVPVASASPGVAVPAAIPLGPPPASTPVARAKVESPAPPIPPPAVLIPSPARLPAPPPASPSTSPPVSAASPAPPAPPSAAAARPLAATAPPPAASAQSPTAPAGVRPTTPPTPVNPPSRPQAVVPGSPAAPSPPVANKEKAPPPSPAPSPMASAKLGEQSGTGDLPFWLDYLVPVASSGLFLFILWLLAVLTFWQ
jgi:serine/threonine protein kinase